MVNHADPLGFNITLRNAGAGTAYTATLSDTLPTTPPGLAWSLAEPVEGCGIAGGKLACTFAKLGPGAAVSVHLVSSTTQESVGTVENTAVAAAANLPAGCTTCSAAASIEVCIPPDCVVWLSACPLACLPACLANRPKRGTKARVRARPPLPCTHQPARGLLAPRAHTR